MRGNAAGSPALAAVAAVRGAARARDRHARAGVGSRRDVGRTSRDTVLPRLRRQHAGAGACWWRWARRSAAPRRAGWSRAGAFPGSALARVGAGAAAGDAAYVMAYAYTDFLQYAGPVQTALRERCSAGRAATTGSRTCARCGGAAPMFVFALYPYVYLLARTAFVERPPALIEAARTLGLSAGRRSGASSCRSRGRRSPPAPRSR